MKSIGQCGRVQGKCQRKIGHTSRDVKVIARLQIGKVVFQGYGADGFDSKRTDKAGLNLGSLPPRGVSNKVKINLLQWHDGIVLQVLTSHAITTGEIRAIIDYANEFLDHLVKRLA